MLRPVGPLTARLLAMNIRPLAARARKAGTGVQSLKVHEMGALTQGRTAVSVEGFRGPYRVLELNLSVGLLPWVLGGFFLNRKKSLCHLFCQGVPCVHTKVGVGSLDPKCRPQWKYWRAMR